MSGSENGLLPAGLRGGAVNSTAEGLASWLGADQGAVIVVVLMIVAGAGLVLNAGMLTAFLREGSRGVGALPISLVIADLLTAACVLPFIIKLFHMSSWPYAEDGCQAFGFTFQLFGGASIYTTTAIAIDRHCTVTGGHQYFSKLGQGKFVLCCWLMALMMSCPPLLGWSSYYLDPWTDTCGPDWTVFSGATCSYVLAIVVVGVLIPISIQAGSYLQLCRTVFAIARKARRSQMSFLQSSVAVISVPVAQVVMTNPINLPHSQTPNPVHSVLMLLESRQRELDNIRHLARVMVCMVSLQILSWLPYVLSLMLVFFTAGWPCPPQLLTAGMALSTLNVVFNPIMNIYQNRKYRSILERCLLPLRMMLTHACQSDDLGCETPDKVPPSAPAVLALPGGKIGCYRPATAVNVGNNNAGPSQPLPVPNAQAQVRFQVPLEAGTGEDLEFSKWSPSGISSLFRQEQQQQQQQHKQQQQKQKQQQQQNQQQQQQKQQQQQQQLQLQQKGGGGGGGAVSVRPGLFTIRESSNTTSRSPNRRPESVNENGCSGDWVVEFTPLQQLDIAGKSSVGRNLILTPLGTQAHSVEGIKYLPSEYNKSPRDPESGIFTSSGSTPHTSIIQQLKPS